PRTGHHRAVDARVHRLARAAGGRPAAAAGDDTRQLHRPGRAPGTGDLTGSGIRSPAMRLLVNIDVPDLAEGQRFYTTAFGLQPARRFGDDAVELAGAG